MTLSGMLAEKAWRRRSCGVGTRGSSRAGSGWGCGRRPGCGTAGRSRATGSSRTGSGSGSGGGAAAASGFSSSVLRNRAASGPSRMLARLLGPGAIEDLLGQIAIGLRRHPVRVVLEHRHSLHRCFREPDRLLDAGGEDTVAEVLLEDLDGLLGVHGPRVH